MPALVLVPAAEAASPASPTAEPSEGTDGSLDTGGGTDETWVFPFDKPLPPAEGDNQALAVATSDGSVTYDLAFALVWAEGDEVLNVNEAHAYASCSDCVAVAVAFQVVLIMDDAQVVVPQNLAVAANYDCYSCITAAIASQLVLSVRRSPGKEDLLALGEVWNRLCSSRARSPRTRSRRSPKAGGLQDRDRGDPPGRAAGRERDERLHGGPAGCRRGRERLDRTVDHRDHVPVERRRPHDAGADTDTDAGRADDLAATGRG